MNSSRQPAPEPAARLLWAVREPLALGVLGRAQVPREAEAAAGRGCAPESAAVPGALQAEVAALREVRVLAALGRARAALPVRCKRAREEPRLAARAVRAEEAAAPVRMTIAVRWRCSIPGNRRARSR